MEDFSLDQYFSFHCSWDNVYGLYKVNGCLHKDMQKIKDIQQQKVFDYKFLYDIKTQ